MEKLKNKRQIFGFYILIAMTVYALGLFTGYLLDESTFVFSNMEDTLLSILQSASHLRLTDVAASFGNELFYLAFILTATLTAYRKYFFCCALIYKGLTAGIFGATLMRVVRSGLIQTRFEIIGCIIFSALTTLTLCLLCWFCAEGALFSRRVIYPPKLKYLLKRKDTYGFLTVFLIISGAMLIIILLKQGDLRFMLSPKGM